MVRRGWETVPSPTLWAGVVVSSLTSEVHGTRPDAIVKDHTVSRWQGWDANSHFQISDSVLFPRGMS